MEEKKSYKKIILIVALLFLFCAVILIGLGIYIHSLSKPLKIVEKTITNTSNYLKPYIFIEEDEYLRKDFTIDSDIKLDIKSDYIDKLATNDATYKSYQAMINRLNASKTKLHVERDLSNKKVFANFNNSIETANLDYKFLIANSTGYYKLGDTTPSYINTGTNNYFETLTNDATTTENNKYLYDFITSKLPTYFEEKDVERTIEKTMVNDKEINTNKTSIKITNDLLNNIKDKLYSDLKNDSKAKSIIEGYDKDFFKGKTKEVKFFDKNQGMTINIYTSTVLSNLVKIEIISSDNTDRNVITYEVIDNNNSIIRIKENDKELYVLDITKKNDDINITVKDNKDNNVGSIDFSNDNKSMKLDVDLNIEKDKLTVSYQSKKNNMKKKSYDRIDTITIKYMQDKTTRFDAKLTANSKISTETNIKENVDEAILEKKLTAEQQEKIDNYLSNYMMELIK